MSRNPAENGKFVADPHEGSALLSEYRIPVRSPWLYSHFLYENTEYSIQSNVSCREMSAADLSASDLCSLL